MLPRWITTLPALAIEYRDEFVVVALGLAYQAAMSGALTPPWYHPHEDRAVIVRVAEAPVAPVAPEMVRVTVSHGHGRYDARVRTVVVGAAPVAPARTHAGQPKRVTVHAAPHAVTETALRTAMRVAARNAAAAALAEPTAPAALAGEDMLQQPRLDLDDAELRAMADEARFRARQDELRLRAALSRALAAEQALVRAGLAPGSRL